MSVRISAGPATPIQEQPQVRLSQVVAALSAALDITEGQPAGHAARTCYLGMRLAETIGADEADRSALFYALLLKDLGCSSNAAKVCYLFGADDHTTKRDVKLVNGDVAWDRVRFVLGHVAPGGTLRERLNKVFRLATGGVQITRQLIEVRCERGASIARMFGLPEKTAEAIRSLDEHWSGHGHPSGLKGEEIPLLARILGLAQTVEVFVAREGVDAAMTMAKRRSGRWFDPALVKALRSMRGDRALWETLRCTDIHERVAALEPADLALRADDAMLDRICFGFAQVVDAKSPWTRRHSEGVSQLAVGIAGEMGRPLAELRALRRVGLLHDIGKLGVSNTILDKPGKLSDDERAAMCRHPAFSEGILRHVPVFRELADLAASHHERLDGKGYYRGLTAETLGPAARALAVADMFEAMSADRPYRDTMPREKVLGILDKDSGAAVCPEAVAALKRFLAQHGYDPQHPSVPESR